MPKTKITKVRVDITLDKELVETIKKHNLKLSTLINNYLQTLFSNPYSRITHNPEVEGSNPSLAILQGFRDESLETCDIKNVYFKTQNDFYVWLSKRDITNNYVKNIKSNLNRLFSKDIKTPLEVKKYVDILPSKKYNILAFRLWVKYCDEYDLMPKNIITSLNEKIKSNCRSNIDSYVPSIKEIEKTLDYFSKNYNDYVILYKILLESGCRVSELKHLITNFDEKNIEMWDNEIILYRNFYLRGTKSSYYIFFTKRTYDIFKSKNYKESNVENMKLIIKRNKLTPLKYTRKYNFTLMIEKEVNFEIANFIQGRVSQNIGFNHYLAKKTIAIKEYKKIYK